MEYIFLFGSKLHLNQRMSYWLIANAETGCSPRKEKKKKQEARNKLPALERWGRHYGMIETHEVSTVAGKSCMDGITS